VKDIKWLEGNKIQIDPPKKTKKITGTRFATILGLNPWSSAFEIWCAVTKTYEVPFEDTIYTIAGKTIEPKQAEYMVNSYGMDIKTPTDIYGADYFQKTWGDFFPENAHLGGMWDYLGLDEDGKVESVLEMKTTKRAEDWENDVPEYYALQAALYAYLKGVEDVIMVASFLEEKDYTDPSKYKPCAANTITVEFKVSERYPNFAEMVAQVEQWWKDYVDTGISPVYDEKKDAEILKALRTNTLSPETDVEALVAEAEGLKSEIDAVSATVADKEKRLKKLNDLLKEHAMKQFRDGDKKVDIKGNKYAWSLARTTKEVTKVNEEALKTDGLFEKYSSTSEETSYRMTVSAIKSK
jgi:predicted phage-related endonuclease